MDKKLYIPFGAAVILIAVTFGIVVARSQLSTTTSDSAPSKTQQLPDGLLAPKAKDRKSSKTLANGDASLEEIGHDLDDELSQFESELNEADQLADDSSFAGTDKELSDLAR